MDFEEGASGVQSLPAQFLELIFTICKGGRLRYKKNACHIVVKQQKVRETFNIFHAKQNISELIKIYVITRLSYHNVKTGPVDLI